MKCQAFYNSTKENVCSDCKVTYQLLQNNICVDYDIFIQNSQFLVREYTSFVADSNYSLVAQFSQKFKIHFIFISWCDIQFTVWNIIRIFGGPKLKLNLLEISYYYLAHHSVTVDYI